MEKTNDSIRHWSGGAGLTRTSIQSVLHMQGFEPHVWLGRRGDIYPLNTVPYHRIIWVAEGTLQVHLPEWERQLHLKRGDRLDLPAGTPHKTVVCSDKLICVEARRYIPGYPSRADLSTKELG